MALRVAKIERIHDHANVRRVFARLANVWDLDHLKGGFMQPALKSLVAIEIAIGLLDDDVPLEEQPVGDLADIESGKLRFMCADGDVLQVKKYSHRGVGVGQAHLGRHPNAERGKPPSKQSVA